MYRFNAIPIKLPMAFFSRKSNKNFHNLYGTQKTPNSQSNLRKKNGAGGIRLPGFRLYYKATVIKIGTSLVTQWLGIHLPMQGTRFDPQSGRISRATEQLSQWATTTESAHHNY